MDGVKASPPIAKARERKKEREEKRNYQSHQDETWQDLGFLQLTSSLLQEGDILRDEESCRGAVAQQRK